LHAENIYATHGFFGDLTASSTLTAGQELFIGLTCVTESELKALLTGPVLGSHTENQSTASAPAHGDEMEAPAATPAPETADTGATSTGITATSSHRRPELERLWRLAATATGRRLKFS